MQDNASSEAPASARVTVIRDGLLDDAVSGERWEIALERTPSGLWTISEARKAWRCGRGQHPDQFAAAASP